MFCGKVLFKVGRFCHPKRIHTPAGFIDHIDHEVIEAEIERDAEVDAKWLKSELAVHSLNLGAVEPQSYKLSSDIQQYMISRGYESTDNHNESSRRVISSCLTFPLSLTYAHKTLFPAVPSKINVLVVGARAESSLPISWWKECLFNNDNLAEMTIKMVGPGVILKPSTSPSSEKNTESNTLEWTHLRLSDHLKDHTDSDKFKGHAHPRVTVSIPNDLEKQKLLHNSEIVMDLLQWADIFVLFNPGMGSKRLRADWDPTLRLLLETRKTIVCTAHGDKDLSDDLNFLNRVSSEEDSQDMGEPLEFLIPPHLNPFRSLKRLVDRGHGGPSDANIVTSNNYLYAVRSK